MSFSAFNVGRQMMTLTSNKIPQLRMGSKPVAGGAFTPTTLEASFVMRSSLDYQYEKAYNDKYKAMMQNRLNDLQKKLQEAYSDLLNVSMSQQVGEEAAANLRADVRLDGTDGTAAARRLQSVAGESGFEDLGIVPKTRSSASNMNETAINYAAPGSGNIGDNIWRAPGLLDDRMDPNYPNPGKYGDDGLSGYGRRLGNDEVQFRTLMDQTTAAGNVTGDMHITMRIEDDPPPPTEISASLDMLNSVTSAILGGPADPTYFNQKLVQQTTSYKTGGFWSAVNYLYNFAPREIKYSYAVGYTANTDEAGNDDYLINGELVDDRDIPGAGQAYLQSGSRVKWQGFDPTEGYQTERSGTTAFFPTVVNREKAWISGSLDNVGIEQDLWDTNFNDADGQVRIVEDLIFQSGTYVYNGTFVNETSMAAADMVNGTSIVNGRVVQTTARAAGGAQVSLLESNIELGSVFRHKVDLTSTVNSANDDRVQLPGNNVDFEVLDRGAIRSSLFFNHYEVETRTVEFNNASRKDVRELTAIATDGDISDDGVGKLYAYGGIERSKAIDTSKNYDLVDPDIDPTTNNNEISRTMGNANNSFNGEFIQGLHKIHSVNGIDVVGNETKQASPVIGDFEIGRYEGLIRSDGMSRNLVDYVPPTEMEVNAANAVPTDWHQAEMLTAPGQDVTDPDDGYVWFPFIEDTLYSRTPDGVSIDPKSGYGRPGSPRQLIQARNTFNLTKEEFMQLEPAANWITDSSGVRRPTYQKRDYIIDLDLRGINYDFAAVPTPSIPKLFVNGRSIDLSPLAPVGGTNPLVAFAVPVPTLGACNLVARINLKDYLQEGYNSISIEASDATYSALRPNNYDEGIRIRAVAPPALPVPGQNDAMSAATINAKIITGYDNVNAVKYNPDFTRADTIRAQSRWQTRVVPLTTENDALGKLAQMASEPTKTGSAYKVANSFIELVLNMINQQKYRDIFKLGLLSNLNKLAIQGSANLPSGASMQGAVTLYYDPLQQNVVLYQDKLIANS